MFYPRKPTFVISKNRINSDKFDIIVKIHRILGLTYYGYYENESKVKHIFYALIHLIIFIIILNISSPCLLNNYYCQEYRNNQLKNIEIRFTTSLIYFAIRSCIGIASSLIYSTRGQQFREIIDDLRKIFVSLRGSHKDFKQLNKFLIIFCSFAILITANFAIINSRKDLNIILFIIEILGHFYICFIYLSTDLFICYFTSYLVIIQKLFQNFVITYGKNALKADEIKDLKTKFVKIQSIIDKISVILSPLLFMNCGTIFYNIVTNLYFRIKVIDKPIFDEQSMVHTIPIVLYLIRLLFYCLSAERLKNQVFFYKLSN
jgi:flagellin-specific chaperone FliS